MNEKNITQKEIETKPFVNKWREFLILYGIINLLFCFMLCIILYKNHQSFLSLYVKDYGIDGSNCSIFVNIFTMPVFFFLVVINIAIGIAFEFVTILIIKSIYFQSVVPKEDQTKLHNYIVYSLMGFAVINLIGILLCIGYNGIFYYICLYLPLAFFIYIFIAIKIRNH